LGVEAGAFSGNIEGALKIADETYALATSQLKTRKLDAEPQLP